MLCVQILLIRLLLADDVDGLLCSLGEKTLDLIFAAHHVGSGGNIALEMDSVKHALGGAQTAADALVGVHDAYAAAEAAAGFTLDLLFGEGETVVLKAACLGGIVQDGLTLGAVIAVLAEDQIVLVELVELTQVTADGEALSFVDEAVQGLSAFTACCDCINCKLGTGVDIAADKNVILLSLVGNGICDCIALLAGLESADIKAAPVDALTDGGENGIDLDGLKLTGADRRTAALLIRLAKLHELDLECGDLAVLADDLGRSVEEAELYALFLCLCDFFLVGGHFVLTAAVDDIGLCAEADSGAADIHCDIAAADDSALPADFGLAAEVDFAQEINTAVNAGQLFAGNAELGALLCADCDIEALVAFFTKLLDGDILADLGVHAEVDAHLSENINFACKSTAVKTIAGDTHDEHTARLGVAVKDGDIDIAHASQIVSAAQTGRACADDCDLLFIVDINGTAAEKLGDITLIALEILLGDELLDLIDCDSFVKCAAGAGIFTAAVADIAADGGEGVVLLDKLESVKISALFCKLDVALNCNVSGACGLAGCGAGLVAVLSVVGDIVEVPLVLAPLETVGELLLGIADSTVLGAELLTELCSAGRADLNTLAAGNAVFTVDMGTVSGCGEVGSVEELAGTKSEADTDITVAQCENLVLTVDVGDLMDIAVVLCTLADLENFFLGNLVTLAGFCEVVCKVTYTDAAVVLHFAGALTGCTAGIAAGAVADGEVVIFVKPVGDMLNGHGFVAGIDCAFNRDDMHADACAAGRYKVGLACEGQEGHLVEHLAELGVLLKLPVNHVGHLGDAGDEELDIVALLMLGILACILDSTGDGSLLEQLLNMLGVFAAELCNLLQILGLTDTHLEHDLCLLIAFKGAVQNDVFRVGLCESLNTELVGDSVGNHFSEIK